MHTSDICEYKHILAYNVEAVKIKFEVHFLYFGSVCCLRSPDNSRVLRASVHTKSCFFRLRAVILDVPFMLKQLHSLMKSFGRVVFLKCQ